MASGADGPVAGLYGLRPLVDLNFMEFSVDGKEVGEARDFMARRCLEHDPRPEYLFFLDDDTLPASDAFTKLFFRLKTNRLIDIAAGVYCTKGGDPADPLIYAGDGCGAYWDWAVGDLLTTEQHGITGTHMGLTLIRVSLFQRMLDAGIVNEETPFYRTIHEEGSHTRRSGTEDLYFYKLAAKLDPPVQIMVDTSVLAGHIDKNTGITWGLPEYSPPVVRARWLKDRDKETPCPIPQAASSGTN